MPDEVERPRPIGGRPRDVDLVDGLAEFAKAYPGWMVPALAIWRPDRGYPVSWRHYCYGMGHLSRAAAREALQHASATAAAQAGQEGFQRWSREVERSAR